MFVAEPTGSGSAIPFNETDYNTAKTYAWKPRWTSRDPVDPTRIVILSDATGVVYTRSQVGFNKVTDGTSNVYMVGEKYMSTDHYDDGLDTGDNEPGFSGANADTLRTTVNRVLLNREIALGPDSPGQATGDEVKFGSAHSGGFNMAMCDASVSFINFDIDPNLHRLQGNRSDGVAIGN
jgi:prepilin-type processing-associated H-X9-DG protein